MDKNIEIAVIQKAIEEIESQRFGLTKQFLEIHGIIYTNEIPKVDRVDWDRKDGSAIIYFPITGEKFYLAIYVDTVPELSVRWVNTESYNCVYFRANSDSLSLKQLSELTTLKATGGRSKDDIRGSGKNNILWKESTLFIEPNPEADEFEDKLKKLLDYLNQDKAGIQNLVRNHGGYIQVAIEFHNGNTMLGGLTWIRN
jgi:hypothetical protein